MSLFNIYHAKRAKEIFDPPSPLPPTHTMHNTHCIFDLDFDIVQAGLRTLHEAGPELKRTISGNLEEDNHGEVRRGLIRRETVC